MIHSPPRRLLQVSSHIEEEEPKTVVVTLSEPLAAFPKLLAMPIASIVPDSTPADFGQHPVGTGPWRFVEWKHDDYLRFAKNQSPAMVVMAPRLISIQPIAITRYAANSCHGSGTPFSR